jgi:hypothetical protein
MMMGLHHGTVRVTVNVVSTELLNTQWHKDDALEQRCWCGRGMVERGGRQGEGARS